MTLYIGPPGTGKSYLLQQLAKEHDGIIIAPTWYCANKIGGQTIYNYCKSSFIRFKPKQFNKIHVFIDEIFMYSREEMKRILQCMSDDTQLFMFGDPFQIKSPNQDGYFWEALDQKPKIIQLTTFYRSKDDLPLQSLLTQYRIDKTIEVDNKFQLIDIKQAIESGAIVLVGTHSAQKAIQLEFNKAIIKKKTGSYGLDSLLYDQGQRLFSISRYGAIQEELFFVRFDGQQMIVKKKDSDKLMSIDPIKGQTIKYPVVHGNVLTVNVAQGQEFDKVIIDSSSFFEFGSFYTALSRAKKLTDVYILDRQGYNKIFEADLQNIYCQ